MMTRFLGLVPRGGPCLRCHPHVATDRLRYYGNRSVASRATFPGPSAPFLRGQSSITYDARHGVTPGRSSSAISGVPVGRGSHTTDGAGRPYLRCSGARSRGVAEGLARQQQRGRVEQHPSPLADEASLGRSPHLPGLRYTRSRYAGLLPPALPKIRMKKAHCRLDGQSAVA